MKTLNYFEDKLFRAFFYNTKSGSVANKSAYWGWRIFNKIQQVFA